MKKVTALIIILALSLSFFTFVKAEPDCLGSSVLPPDEREFCIKKIDEIKASYFSAQEKNKSDLAGLRKQLNDLNSRIAAMTNQLKRIEQDIVKREDDLAYTKEIFEEKAGNHYKFIRLYDPIMPFLSASDASEAFREINFRQKAADEDRKTMGQYADDLAKLKNDKELLEKNKVSLASIQKEVGEKEKFLAGEVAKVESYLATLSAKQQQFIAQKLGSLNLPTSLGGGPLYCTDDRNLNPGFSPAFAFYTFGIPHRVGMNQYGAYGRANANQNHEEILKAYFNNINFETKPNINITVDGYGSMPLETYLLGIYEMPESWPLEALKAQAIAARSYALAYTNNGGKSICTSQSCQVYKQPPKSGNWKTAVEQTSGKVMTQGGQVITAWYASTAGGYTFTSADVGWSGRDWTKRLRDTTGGVGGFGDLQASAYDKASPCFYAAQGFRSQYGKSAWLKPEEVADIANVVLLAKADGSTKNHLYQPDKPNPEGTDTWDAGRVRQELSSRGVTPLTSASSVSISGVDWGTGRTTQVSINGVSFDASEFKDFFNLRAPANIQIVGPLYNIEKK